jgi:hypothetical protein
MSRERLGRLLGLAVVSALTLTVAKVWREVKYAENG